MLNQFRHVFGHVQPGHHEDADAGKEPVQGVHEPAEGTVRQQVGVVLCTYIQTGVYHAGTESTKPNLLNNLR